MSVKESMSFTPRDLNSMKTENKIYKFWKRTFDLAVSISVLFLFSPILLLALIAVWSQDRKSPIYVANRVGINNTNFKMYKVRSMIVNAEANKVDSTSANDVRITKVGKYIRKFKIDELAQLFNVLIGNMSLVGPRPNVSRDVMLYTEQEKVLLTVKPGITDFASIVFSDEGELLSTHEDPDLAYNQIIRPTKSRLGLHYIEKANFFLDIRILLITFVVIFSRKWALRLVGKLLVKSDAEDQLIKISSRKSKLVPTPPPGSNEILLSRNLPHE
jgi:lipopolysaccharide/colanic/teichoic acid biosynthesis glycosyltransferase